MILGLFLGAKRNRTVASLYGMIVAQARAEAFYTQFGVPDTVTGRFELLVLHAVLLLRRLERGSEPVRQLGQGVFDRFCADMDASMREWGVGDPSVPKKMMAVGEAFYGRQAAYMAALEVPGPAMPLSEALARNILGVPVHSCGPGLARLAHYVQVTARTLDALDEGALVAGVGLFPDPAEGSITGGWSDGRMHLERPV
jgi:cytochrome b pre-mRNA-processing protein 3